MLCSKDSLRYFFVKEGKLRGGEIFTASRNAKQSRFSSSDCAHPQEMSVYGTYPKAH